MAEVVSNLGDPSVIEMDIFLTKRSQTAFRHCDERTASIKERTSGRLPPIALSLKQTRQAATVRDDSCADLR